MAEFYAEKRVVVSADAASLARSVASRFVHRVIRRLETGRLVHISLTGGSMGGAVLSAVLDNPKRERIDWSRVHFWWSDERFVARSDEQRNDAQARAALLDAVGLPGENVHTIASPDDGVDIETAATLYADELARFPHGQDAWPSFDICFLGVGPDGHIASLFPDRPEIRITDRAVVAVHDSPKPPPERLTMTRPVINSSKRVWMVLTGADKASALGLALAGASYDSVPVAGAKGRKRTVFFVDEAAASEVPPELIDGEY